LKPSVNAQLFWLSFFKPQLSCSSDEFFEAVRQFSEMSGIPEYFSEHQAEFDALMKENKYVVSVEEHSQSICKIIDEMIGQVMARNGTNGLLTQFKLYQGQAPASKFANAGSLKLDANSQFDFFKGDNSELGQLTLKEITKYASCNL